MTHPLRRTAAICVVLALAACRAGSGSVPPSASVAAPSATAEPSDAPEPSVSPSVAASESATPAPSNDPESAFTVAPNADADALFLDRDECENIDDGYRLEFPDAWYTNTEIGDVEPCSWFSPIFYEVDDSEQVPSEIGITIQIVPGEVGTVNEFIFNESGIVGETQSASRFEERGTGTEGSEFPPSYRAYVYVVQLGPTLEGGPNLMATTTTKMGGDYELNKAILDRIVATMEFIGTVE